jgi:hypothetical protein
MGAKTRLNSEDDLSGIPDIENFEIDELVIAPRPSTTE